MSNIAGKAYAMNVVTPIHPLLAWVNKLIFWFTVFVASKPFFWKLLGGNPLTGLLTLSLIHYARWAIVSSSEFPCLDEEIQDKENLKYSYMFFFSNFNGSWEQYVDSFHMAIPDGLDLFWWKNIKYPKSVPLQPFYAYITFNQIWTNHYYNAYPMAASNDVKSAKKVKAELLEFDKQTDSNETPEDFQKRFNQLLFDLQTDINLMEPTPIVSLSAQTVAERRKQELTNQAIIQQFKSSNLDLATTE